MPSAPSALRHPHQPPLPVQRMRSEPWVSPLSGRSAVWANLKVLAWGFASVVLAVAALFIVQLVFGAEPTVMTIFLAAMLSTAVAVPLGMWVHIVRPLGQGWSIIGWRKPQRSVAHVLWQAPFVMMTAGAVQVLVMTALGLGEPSSTEQNESLAEVVSDVGAAQLAVVYLSVAVIVPIWEELAFRGMLYGSLRTRLRLIPAALLGGLLFGLAHGNLLTLPYLFVTGVACCILAEWYKSAIPTMLCHGFNNSVVFVVLVMAI